ncbi:MAG: c-type cytochrome [Betaproteobacteria bacterium]|nr:c-type cytochrome [Betaproteobacteria bacterium]
MNAKRLAAAMAIAVLGAVGMQAWAAEGNAAAGETKTEMCAGCHGIEGYRTAYPDVYSVPKLGGQNAPYIVSALKAYKSGDRTHPTMRGIAATLSDQDMADIAAFYSSTGN